MNRSMYATRARVRARSGIWRRIELDSIFAKAPTYVRDSGNGEVRKDKYGAEIRRWSHGAKTGYGWEVDHIVPVSKGGTDELSNLQPLHWENNRLKGDS